MCVTTYLIIMHAWVPEVSMYGSASGWMCRSAAQRAVGAGGVI